MAVLIIICKYFGGAGAVMVVCGAVGEFLPCARKKLERAVCELCRGRGKDSAGFFGPEEPPLVVHQASERGAPLPVAFLTIDSVFSLHRGWS